MIELPTDLPADLVPLAWLVGTWEGTGVIDYEADGHRFTGEFSHRVSFTADAVGALAYAASAHLRDAEETPLVSESGYWRLARPATASDPGPGLLPARAAGAARAADDVEALRTAEGGFELVAAIVHADGLSELYVGQVRGPRIDIATDAVVSPPGAGAYGAATRMYGLVEGHLLWAWDIAALGGELGSHASARLAKVDR
ncbi:MAG: FABP family protein [Microbacterium sp.]|uniref:FABP family protein n=1 Tax=Microbacterium sp. TaxID=51671 RepID=UPI0039E42300